MSLFTILLALHIAGGGTALLVGTFVLSLRKGDKNHKLVGNIFFFSMLAAALISLPMAYLHPNYFLFIVGVFTTYMLLSGRRYLKIKDEHRVTFFDWSLTVTMLVFGLAFIGFGLLNLIRGFSFGTVFLSFGGVGLLFTYQDYKNFSGGSKFKNFWLTGHIQRMMGSYIASATAFLVVNNTWLPNIVAWMLPTAILTPLIVRWIRKNGVLRRS